MPTRKATPVRIHRVVSAHSMVIFVIIERLVHGPLTSLMLLETAVFTHPDLKLKSFEYRALNPLVVNQPVTIHGAWEKASEDKSEKALLVWAVGENDVVGMSGRITL